MAVNARFICFGNFASLKYIRYKLHPMGTNTDSHIAKKLIGNYLYSVIYFNIN
jgi:hypothetical protein